MEFHPSPPDVTAQKFSDHKSWNICRSLNQNKHPFHIKINTMKTATFIFAVIFAVFGLLCTVSYFWFQAFHFGLFAGIAYLISWLMFIDLKGGLKHD
jgi:hypothetical protein